MGCGEAGERQWRVTKLGKGQSLPSPTPALPILLCRTHTTNMASDHLSSFRKAMQLVVLHQPLPVCLSDCGSPGLSVRSVTWLCEEGCMVSFISRPTRSLRLLVEILRAMQLSTGKEKPQRS